MHNFTGDSIPSSDNNPPPPESSITHIARVLRSDIPVYSSEDISSDTSDAAQIARGIFRDEVADIIKVLKACGALGTVADRVWAVRQLWRLMSTPSSGDVVKAIL